MNNTIRLLSALIRSAIKGGDITDGEKALFSPEMLPRLHKISVKHDIAPIVATALVNNALMSVADDEYYQMFKKEQFTAVYRTKGFEYETQRISQIFEANQIKYIPLKGSVIRKFYPEPWMRTSCDIDILISKPDTEKALKILTEEGYRYEREMYHDLSLYSESGVHLELHFSILEDREDMDKVLCEVWENTVASETYRTDLTNEFFITYIVSHMANHFLNGGCGLRALIDLWIIKNKMNLNFENASELLNRAGTYKFAKEMMNVSAYIFGEREHDDVIEKLLLYIVKGGIYGLFDNAVVVSRARESTFKYTLRRLFPPARNISTRYPILKKAPILLPFCWIIRIITAIFTERSRNEFKKAGNVTDAEMENMIFIREKLGI